MLFENNMCSLHEIVEYCFEKNVIEYHLIKGTEPAIVADGFLLSVYLKGVSACFHYRS